MKIVLSVGLAALVWSTGAQAQLPPKTPAEFGTAMRQSISLSAELLAEATVAVQCRLRSESWGAWAHTALQHETEQDVAPNLTAMQLPSRDALHWYVAGALMEAGFVGLDRFFNQLGHAACDEVRGSTALHILDTKVADARR